MNEKEMYDMIAGELNIQPGQVERAVQLFDDGNTIPFIARYRKEATGSLDEDLLRRLQDRIQYLRNLSQRKEDVLRLIEEQGQLTPDLQQSIEKAIRLQEVEDLYRPYRPKRQTRATKARERGLEPLAKAIYIQESPAAFQEWIKEFLNPEQGVETEEDALQGARDIIAEWVTDDARVRQGVRRRTWQEGMLQSTGQTEEHTPYEMYYEYTEAVKSIPPHRYLALNRGEEEEFLKVQLMAPEEECLKLMEQLHIKDTEAWGADDIQKAIEDGYRRLLKPAVEREIRNELWDTAEQHAIGVFATNLQNLLMQPPVRGKVVMGIDPGYRTGSKVVVVDETGRLVDTETIYPHAPQNKWDKARRILMDMAHHWQVDILAIGNGTACRETEQLASDIIDEMEGDTKYIVVDEAGASVYSASELARKEFPDLDVSMRGAVSIARRLQDPLAELVKIDPRSMGVGLYQHDVAPARLKEKLEQVVETCVNHVGVDVNTASSALLQYVAGMNRRVATALIQHREEHGSFEARDEFLKVKGMGKKTFEQAAGFLRIYSQKDPLARTPIHPESYAATERLLQELEFSPADLETREKSRALNETLKGLELHSLTEHVQVGIPTLQDIVDALKKPGRDPREGLPGPIFRTNVLTIEDLEEGMLLLGTVRNVVDFGAFVDIGVKEDGLVHISQLSHKYVRDPLDVVAVGDIVRVQVLGVDVQRKRIALTMKLPADQ